MKRLMDILIVLIGSTIALPLIGVIAVIIRIDSKGKVFYQHKRIGKNGQTIGVWKFRTMVENADQILDEYLSLHPEARQEWDKLQKLKDDPRITRFGRILRKSSLDEIPQMWNVLLGEMSIVGPRPIVKDEICYYGDAFSLYTQLRPGITGLWQVSGRNDVGYEMRVYLDEYYVRNWSMWLDLYILIKTVWVVLACRGAY